MSLTNLSFIFQTLNCAIGPWCVPWDFVLCYRIVVCAIGFYFVLQDHGPCQRTWSYGNHHQRTMLGLIDCILFGVLLENSSSLIWERHHCRRRRLRNLGPCSALTAFEAGEIFIVPRLLWQGFLAYRDSSDIFSLSDHRLRQASGPDDLFYPGNPRDATCTCMCTIERSLQALH